MLLWGPIEKNRCLSNKLALLYNFTSVYTNISSFRRDESKTTFPLQEAIFVYSQVFVQ